jgi:hypothetical protein
MQPRWLALSDRMYRILLQAYPASFRKRFAAEMAQVFGCQCREAYVQSGAGGVLRLWLPTLWDWAWAAIYQWWIRLFRRRMETMQTNSIDRTDGIRPLSAVQAGAAALPFLAFGIASMASKLEFFHTYPATLPLWQILLIDPYLVFNWLILLGLGAGILAGFPRWAYSFLGWAIVFAWWWSDMGFYGYSLGWKIWLPLLGVFAITLLMRRSWQPMRALLAGIWMDWTLASLSIYIFYGWGVLVFDEVHHPYLLAFIAATALAFSLGVWGYFRSAAPLRRVLALVGGLFLTILLPVIINAAWDYRAYSNLQESTRNVNLIGLFFFAGLALLMLGNGWLADWWRRRDDRLKGT